MTANTTNFFEEILKLLNQRLPAGGGGVPGLPTSPLTSDPSIGQPTDVTAVAATLESDPATAYTAIQLLKLIAKSVDGIEPVINGLTISSDAINLNTNDLETITAAIRDRLPAALVGGRLAVQVDSATTPVSTSSNWRSRRLTSSDLQFTDTGQNRRGWMVPYGYEWQTLGCSLTWVSSSTAGNRQIELYINPSNNTAVPQGFRFQPGAVQAASLTRYYQWAIGEPYLTAFVDTNKITRSLPPWPLGQLSMIAVWDENLVHPAGDTISDLQLLVLERAV